MKLLITGASGFLGKYLVQEALKNNHKVVALVRDKKNINFDKLCHNQNLKDLEIIEGNLLQTNSFKDKLIKIDTVIHLAVVKTGTFDEQFNGTIIATQNILNVMKDKNISRLILVSSFSVYDYLKINFNDVINENSPLEINAKERDIYAQTKLEQEKLCQSFVKDNPRVKLTIVRPGIIYDQNNLWNAHLGVKIKHNYWLIVKSESILPITYVENCANAIVKACNPNCIGKIINIVDDDLPTQQEYLHQIIQVVKPKPRLLFLNFKIISFIAQWLWFLNQNLFKGKFKQPSILIPSRLQARFLRFQYDNTLGKELLNWQSEFSFSAIIKKMKKMGNDF